MRSIVAALVLVVGLVASSAPASAQCTACCAMPCGDGILDSDEDCDDGNVVDGDGCPSDCRQTSRVTVTNFANSVCAGSRSQDYFGAMVILPDGRPFVATQTETGTTCFNPRVGLARYTRLGAPDPTFGGGTGRLAPTTTVHPRFPAAAVYQPSPRDRIVVGGTSIGSSGASFMSLSAFLPDGTLDRDRFGVFGTGGTTNVSFGDPPGSREADLNALVPLSSTFMLAAGRASPGGAATTDDFALALIGMDGYVEFSETIDFAGGSDHPGAIAVLTNPARTVIVGTTSTPSVYSAIVMAARRVNGFDLEPDFSFAPGAQRVLEGIGAPCSPSVADAVARPDGRIVIVGSLWCPPTTYRVLLVQTQSNGTLDTTFGDGGVVIDEWLGADRPVYVQNVALLSDGRALVSGIGPVSGAPRSEFVLARYLKNGQRDPTFGPLKELEVPGQLSGLSTGLRLAHEFDARVGGAIFLGGTSSGPSTSDYDVVLHRRRLVETCGDGVLQPDTEACDGGSFNGFGGRACCSPTCTIVPDGAICDDGIDQGVLDYCDQGVCVNFYTATTTTTTTTTTLPSGNRDLAVLRVKGTGTVKLSPSKPVVHRIVKVQIQNRGSDAVTVPDLATLGAVVRLRVDSLGGCPAPPATLMAGRPQKTLPRTLRRKGKLIVAFSVPILCGNDSATGDGREDYRLVATVDHAALGGQDVHTIDDVCPRMVTAPGVVDPFPDGSIRDRGCGMKRPDRTYGDPLLIDVSGSP